MALHDILIVGRACRCLAFLNEVSTLREAYVVIEMVGILRINNNESHQN
ncbi:MULTISPECIES: hypothetical protein [Pseudomonas putida group]|jgi:hypothetical protein|nr:hypothetical protein [Pseudomonas putida]